MISRNMEGDTTGSQLLGNRGSEPLSTTLRSSIQRLKDSRGGSMPANRRADHGLDLVCGLQAAQRWRGTTWALEVRQETGRGAGCQELPFSAMFSKVYSEHNWFYQVC